MAKRSNRLPPIEHEQRQIENLKGIEPNATPSKYQVLSNGLADVAVSALEIVAALENGSRPSLERLHDLVNGLADLVGEQAEVDEEPVAQQFVSASPVKEQYLKEEMALPPSVVKQEIEVSVKPPVVLRRDVETVKPMMPSRPEGALVKANLVTLNLNDRLKPGLSLSEQLAKKMSPMSQWMESHTNAREIRRMSLEMNDELAECELAWVEGTDTELTETAFGYGFRWLVGTGDGLTPAAIGGDMTDLEHKGQVGLVNRVVKRGKQSHDVNEQAQSAIILALFERYWRSGQKPSALKGVVSKLEQGKAQGESVNELVDELYQHTPLPAVADVALLLNGVPKVWGNELKEPFVFNIERGGVDWLVEGTLYRCSCSQMARPVNKQVILQMLGYLLLDTSDQYRIGSVGWYYARRGTRFVYSLRGFVDRLCRGRTLEKLRDDFSLVVDGRSG